MLLLELTKRCNNACRFCSQAEERAAGGCSERSTLEALEVSGQTIAIVGGEPTLIRELPELAAEVVQRGAGAVWLQTNARRLAYRSYAQQLADSGVRALEVSLQGSTAAMHEYHTRAEGSFAQTVRGMAHAAQSGMRVVATAVVTRSNLRHLDAIVRVAHAAGASAVRLRRVRAVGGALREPARLVPAPAIATPYLYEARAVGEQLGVAVFFETVSDETLPFIDHVGGPPEARLEHAPSRDAAGPAGRARPGLAEDRGRDRLSGDALRDIFPGLFEPAAEKG